MLHRAIFISPFHVSNADLIDLPRGLPSQVPRAPAVVLHPSLTLSHKDLRLDNSQIPLSPSAMSLTPM
jgi:hypothetical protein